MAERDGPRVDVRLDKRERGVVAFVTLDNQKKLNTLNRALMTEINRGGRGAVAMSTICARWS